MQVIPLSCKGRWQESLNDPNKDKNVLIKDLSYELMLNFLDMRHEKNWNTCIGLEFRRYKVKKNATPINFIEMMMKGKLKIQYLRKLAAKIQDLSVEKCFYQTDPDYRVYENARIRMAQNASRGFVKDISNETLKEIAELIAECPYWKKIGDGLGFNLSECFSFSDPYEMLKKWIEASPYGTLNSIYFEAERLGYYKVCKYLDGIPLNKTTAIVARDPYAFCPESRPVTVFDLDKLDEIYGMKIKWEGISHLIFNSFDSKKQDIWLAGNISLAQLKDAFAVCHEGSLDCFEQLLTGVSYNQVAFLASAIDCDSSMTQKEFFKLIRNKLTPCDYRIQELSIPNLLCVYWQINRELDLTDFFDKTFDLICFDHSSTARLLGCAYELINPKRYYTNVSSQQLVNLNCNLENHKSSK